ncbi:molybdopterin-dependent oxidoreductase [Streptomyces nigra]|uniref:molybdopterin-dependent oxidoreductase n=1 Tax=Streptomyces nigra TaxID=1827580 RepID=UPI0037D89EB6
MRTEVDRIAEPWGERTPYGRGAPWPVRVDSYLEPGVTAGDVDAWVPTASVLHSNGDAMDVAVARGRIVGVRGSARDRVNQGRLGPKDLFGWQANRSEDRLTTPLVRRGGRLEPCDWDTAMARIVDRSKDLLEAYGPGSIGFYTSGQLFLEEYYTLAVIARAGVGTHHIDGNTRLCTATAAEALKETFGCDGQPASCTDVDHADVLALFGHNMAETQPVLWMRVLDRLAGPEPPRLVCVDPRPTQVARHATVHLAPRPGTNVALLNALLHEIIRTDRIDRDFIDAHTVGFDELAERVADRTPEWAAGICDVPADAIAEAAEILGDARRLLSTVLQGVYQSHQATAAAVQVNNLQLIRGMLGRPGCGVLQMNGQPSAQNTRECGADGDLPGFRNWENDAHVADLARVWNVEPTDIPSPTAPTPAMQIFRYAEQGSIRMLWISGTNPAVSLPELERVRGILRRDGLFTVVQDLYLTETARFADVVLPAATWVEKTGTLTNADRTVHLSERAAEPPGDARPDLDIWLEYARWMDFRDRDGRPLVGWHDPESAFEAWKECSRGRPCDYTGLTYDRLRATGGIQWPCTDEAPDGTERLYADGVAWAAPDDCETYGRDLVTGASVSETEYRALNPHGRAVLKAATPPGLRRSGLAQLVPPHSGPGRLGTPAPAPAGARPERPVRGGAATRQGPPGAGNSGRSRLVVPGPPATRPSAGLPGAPLAGDAGASASRSRAARRTTAAPVGDRGNEPAGARLAGALRDQKAVGTPWTWRSRTSRSRPARLRRRAGPVRGTVWCAPRAARRAPRGGPGLGRGSRPRPAALPFPLGL